MVTIGYGDIKGVNGEERLCTIVIMVIGAGLYAFNLNDISRIVGNYNTLANQYK
jgi:Ion channel